MSSVESRVAAALEGRAEVLDAYLFGSQARGNARLGSDIDVAVFVADKALTRPGWSYELALIADLMVALETNDVDVVVLNRAPPLLYHEVLRDGVRLIARDLQATTIREGQALSRYCDYVPQLAKIEAAARRVAKTART